MRSVQGKGKAVSSGTRPRLLVLLLVDPGEPDVAHALLHLQPQMIQLRSHTWTENDVRQHGTTAQLPSCPSCSPSHSIDRTQAPVERRDRLVVPRRDSIAATPSTYAPPQNTSRRRDSPPPFPCPSGRPTLGRNSAQLHRWRAPAPTSVSRHHWH